MLHYNYKLSKLRMFGNVKNITTRGWIAMPMITV